MASSTTHCRYCKVHSGCTGQSSASSSARHALTCSENGVNSFVDAVCFVSEFKRSCTAKPSRHQCVVFSPDEKNSLPLPFAVPFEKDPLNTVFPSLSSVHSTLPFPDLVPCSQFPVRTEPSGKLTLKSPFSVLGCSVLLPPQCSVMCVCRAQINVFNRNQVFNHNQSAVTTRLPKKCRRVTPSFAPLSSCIPFFFSSLLFPITVVAMVESKKECVSSTTIPACPIVLKQAESCFSDCFC